MTKEDVERIIEEEELPAAYNILEDRPDKENEVVVKKEEDHFVVYLTNDSAQIEGHPVKIIREEDAFDMFLSRLRAIKTKRFEQLFYDQGAERILRNEISKTFVSRHDFDTNYQELYKAKGGKYYSVTRIDPAPGGYGEEFMYIKEVYALNIDENGKSYSDEELMLVVLSEGEKLK